MNNPEVNNKDQPEQPALSGQPTAAEWVLECEHLPEGKVILQGPVVIGRGGDCDLVIAEPYLSRRHVSIQVSEGCLQVQDLGSANGTYINGERISQGEAATGDEIRLDQLVFKVVGPDPAGPEATQLRDPEATALHAVADQEGTALLAGAVEEQGRTRLIDVPQAYLVGEHAGSEIRFELKAGVNRIGRAPDNEVSLNQPSVSFRHAELIEQQGQWTLTDLNSTNGTFVNDSRVETASLASGERLRFGEVECSFFRECPPGGQPARHSGSGSPAVGNSRRNKPWWLKLLLILLFLGSCGAGVWLLMQQGILPGS